MSQPSPESLPAESKPAALDLLGMHGQDDASSDLRLETPPELQRQIPWHAGHTETAPASPPWSPIPLVLGIMLVCLLFLITARVYGAQMAQLGIERKSLLEQVGYLSSELTSCQNQGIPGTVRELPHDIGEKCPARWSHSTNRSYLFSPKKRRWDQCKYSCSSHSASLITMDSREELDFIMTESFHYSEDRGSTTYYFPFWTGLVYDSVRGKWFWADGTTLSSGMIQLPDPSHANYSGGACAYVQGGTARTGRCEETRFCICEKMMEPAGKN